MERGLAAAPGSVPTFNGAVASVEKIRFFGGPITSGSKLHVSVGHDTVMAQVIAFGVPDGEALDHLVENSTLSKHTPRCMYGSHVWGFPDIRHSACHTVCTPRGLG